MQDKKTKPEKTLVGKMQKRREKMADEKRYIIYYTFEKNEKIPVKIPESETKKDV
ncbi:MAG: hypothetical protein LC768_08895 [Acidobacteria bacterium]|nr:hypothetical protein [Acidobacteriota bacterium]MCA1638434.1 hypothetical protein [Acidobacteriota bacterium]